MIGGIRRIKSIIEQYFPKAAPYFERMARRFFGRIAGVYPRPLGNEIQAVAHVLRSPGWNMAYGSGLVHERLEAAFSEYVGVSNAIAVNTGGMALQMGIRGLGLKPGHELLLQVDTCSASALAILNAGVTPIFSDISEQSFMLPETPPRTPQRERVQGIVCTHMWGNPDDVVRLKDYCARENIVLIEDACLALGGTLQGQKLGSFGKIGVFSFGCLKPIQAGEGGMITTNDDALARELRSLRHWGDRTIDFGVRDTVQLAWNGRMSEIVAAVALEQLKGYHSHLRQIRAAVADFEREISRFDGLELVTGTSDQVGDPAYTQVVLRVDRGALGMTSRELRAALEAQGIGTWYPNFEQIPSLTFFKGGAWRDWVLKGDIDKAAQNYRGAFINSDRAAQETGLGIPKQYFQSKSRQRNLVAKLEEALRR
jgi:dTDP-4-amino-4,6-dideoxygalactose transaminase